MIKKGGTLLLPPFFLSDETAYLAQKHTRIKPLSLYRTSSDAKITTVYFKLFNNIV